MRIPRIKNFVRIGRADCRNLVGTFDCALHKVDAAVVFKQGSLVGRNTEHVLKQLHSVNSLILNVVNCEDRFDVFVARRICVHCRIVNGGESRLPVVAMDYVGLKVDMRNYFKYRTGEESESLRIIVVTVDRVTLEIILIVQKIVYNAVVLCLKNSAVLTSPCNRNRDMSDELHLFL